MRRERWSCQRRGLQKVVRMIYCMGEASKARRQTFLKGAESITLIRDARKHRLCIRYVASRKDTKFHSHRGVLGWTRQNGLSGRNIAEDTLRILKEFCISYSQGPTPVKRRGIWRHIKARVHQLVVDSASDELVAGELCRCIMDHDMKPILPNCKLLLRDKAHASRRPMSRPWLKHQAISELLKTIMLRSSPARMIQNSDEFRSWFKKREGGSTPPLYGLQQPACGKAQVRVTREANTAQLPAYARTSADASPDC